MPGRHWDTDRKCVRNSFPITEGNGRRPAGRSREACGRARGCSVELLESRAAGSREEERGKPSPATPCLVGGCWPRPAARCWAAARAAWVLPGPRQTGGWARDGVWGLVPAMHRPGAVPWPGAQGSALGGGGRGSTRPQAQRSEERYSKEVCIKGVKGGVCFCLFLMFMSQRVVETITNSSNIIYQLLGVFCVLNALFGILGALACSLPR